MKLFNLFNFVTKNKCLNKLQFLNLHTRNYFNYINILRKYDYSSHKHLSVATEYYIKKHSRKIHETTSTEDEFEEYESSVLEEGKISYYFEDSYAKHSLYDGSEDKIICSLNDSVSVQELFNNCNKYKNEFKNKHAVQAILVLSDLQKMFHTVANPSDAKKTEFIQELHARSEFQELLSHIRNNVKNLNRSETSQLLLNLSLLGVPVNTDLMQLLVNKAKNDLMENFVLEEASKFFEVVFSEVSLRAYLTVEELIPSLLGKIDNCNADDLKHLTMCLIKMYRLVTREVLQKYKERLIYLKDNGSLTSEHSKTILKVLTFLCIRPWRDENTKLMSDCMLLLQGHLNELNAYEMITLYDTYFKIQQPGEMLNEIQRCALKLLRKMDEEITQQSTIQLKLFSSLVYFLSPLQRRQYQKIARKYVFYANNYNRESLLVLARILSYIKVSDSNLCEILWRNLLEHAKSAKNDLVMLKLCQDYVAFHTDVDNYRFKPFENYSINYLKTMMSQSIIRHIPSKVSSVLTFALVYGRDKVFLDHLIDILEENWEQLHTVNCLFLAQSIKTLNTTPSKYFSRFELHRLNKLINKVVEREIKNLNGEHTKVTMLLKSCILRNVNKSTILKLMECINDMKILSSRNMENITFCLLNSSILNTDLLNGCIDYVNENKNHILGFKAEKVLYVCYFLGYQSSNVDAFIDTVINLVIRDQERLTGLAILQTSLSLCFYNKLPQSFIKMIFNVEFMEKLDSELENCYSKDVYPRRVRNKLMQLNRAVCLGYPEANIPWFHEKYIEVAKNQVAVSLEKQRLFPHRVKTYLSQIFEKPEYINEHVITPYGYHVDFEINLDQHEKIIEPGSASVKRKLAVILLQKSAFTDFCVQLKGKFQLMKRHLEILGYEVIFINFSEWINLVYAGQRIDFLSNLIWSEKQNQSCKVVDR